MIGAGLKKLAARHNMTIKKGVAYGNMLGYATTLSEGAGTKYINISTTFPTPQKSDELLALLQKQDLEKEYRVTNILFSPNAIYITFYDNPGTMKKLEAFIDYFYPLLKEFEASPYNICTECRCEIVSGSWKLINNCAFYFHNNCVEKVKSDIAYETEVEKQEDTGSYISGFIGALLGSCLGAVVWAIVLSLGYIASLIGLLIGLCSEKGYTLFRGKNGKGKLFILILTALFAVLLGTIGGETLSLVNWIRKGELPGYTFADIPLLLVYLIMDAEYLAAVGKNILVGIIFAALGIFSLLRKTSKEVSTVKVIDL